jgi:hypothetical protein
MKAISTLFFMGVFCVSIIIGVAFVKFEIDESRKRGYSAGYDDAKQEHQLAINEANHNGFRNGEISKEKQCSLEIILAEKEAYQRGVEHTSLEYEHELDALKEKYTVEIEEVQLTSKKKIRDTVLYFQNRIDSIKMYARKHIRRYREALQTEKEKSKNQKIRFNLSPSDQKEMVTAPNLGVQAILIFTGTIALMLLVAFIQGIIIRRQRKKRARLG